MYYISLFRLKRIRAYIYCTVQYTELELQKLEIYSLSVLFFFIYMYYSRKQVTQFRLMSLLNCTSISKYPVTNENEESLRYIR